MFASHGFRSVEQLEAATGSCIRPFSGQCSLPIIHRLDEAGIDHTASLACLYYFAQSVKKTLQTVPRFPNNIHTCKEELSWTRNNQHRNPLTIKDEMESCKKQRCPCLKTYLNKLRQNGDSRMTFPWTRSSYW